MAKGGTAARGARIPARVDTITFNSPQGTRLLVRVFPPDPRLAADIQRTGLAVLGQSASDDDFLGKLQAAMRPWYPRLTIHQQEDLASMAPVDRTWYAMRDGRVHQPDPRADRLFEALGTARDLTAEADDALGRARSLREAVATRPSAKTGRTSAGEPHEDASDG